MRARVGEGKLMCLEALEDAVDWPLTDGAWNALARLSAVDLSSVELWLTQAAAEARRRREHGE